MTPRLREPVRRGAAWMSRVGLEALRATIPRELPLPHVGTLPEGRPLHLPGRGETFVVDAPGPTENAPTVLLLHGLATGTYLTWMPAMEALSRHYHVVAFDQRWHARGITSHRFRLEDCADDAAALLDALDLDRVVVAGYSMGGALAQVLWRRHPDRVAGLVLCSTAMRWTGNVADRLFFSALEAASHPLRRITRPRVHEHARLLPEVVPPPRDLDALREWIREELRATSLWSLPEVMGALAVYDSSGWMGAVDVPTAVVITGRDLAIPTRRQREMAEAIPDAVVSEAPGGHTSLVFDTRRWLPLFLDAVASVTQRTMS